MQFTTLSKIKQYTDNITAFRGYNHNLRIGDGEFYDVLNTTAKDYPVLSVRDKRDTTVYNPTDDEDEIITRVAGISQFDKQLVQIYIKQTSGLLAELRLKLKISATEYDFALKDTTTLDLNFRKIIKFGAYLLIFPDKIWVNMASYDSENAEFEHGNIETSTDISTTTTNISYTLCDIEGTVYSNVGTTQPTSPANGDLWIDTSSTPHELKRYSSALSEWVTIATTYIKIAATGINTGFAKGDAVHITGSTVVSDGYYPIWAIGTGYIVITGILDTAQTQTTGTVTVARTMPDYDYITVAGNRLWGCHYKAYDNTGTSSGINEIFCSKLGDFKNWYYYAGTTMDSYTVSLGQDEIFTGATTLNDNPVFFREHYIHTIYGDYPSNYSLSTYNGSGVKEYCNDSIAEYQGTIYYLSEEGVCAYSGGYPTVISEEFGDIKYGGGGLLLVAGLRCCAEFMNGCYYLLCHTDASQALFVYDTKKGIWHKESPVKARCMCKVDEKIYYLSPKSLVLTLNTETKCLSPSTTSTEKVQWYAESGIIDLNIPGKKYISMLQLRVSVPSGSSITIKLKYDSQDNWEYVTRIAGTRLQSFTIPLRMKRTDHVQLMLEGAGKMNLYSLTKTYSYGSDT